MKKRNIKALVNKTIRGSKYADLIEKISLFGSYMRGEEKKDSDIDLLIYFVPMAPIGFFELHHIQNALEEMLGAKVDLVERDGLSPYLKDIILSEAKPVYEK